MSYSKATIADNSESTFEALQQKHPPPHPDTYIPPLGDQPLPTAMSIQEIFNAIWSFHTGSSGGPDGLRPQHLKDMTGPTANGTAQVLLPALASFVATRVVET